MIDIDFKYYFSLFLRHLPLFLLVWAPLAAVGLIIAYTAPPVYQSGAKILVESPQISTSLYQETVNVRANEVIQTIQQRLMTRANLLDIAERFRVFPPDSNLSPTQKVERMRNAATFELLTPGARNRRSAAAASAFTISFRHTRAPLTARVTNELVTLILEQNVQIRTDRAAATTAFFEQQVGTLGSELAELEASILNFKNENASALPDSLEFRRGEMSRIQGRLLQLESQELSLREQASQIQRVIDDPSLSITTNPAQLSQEERDLISLRNTLAQKRAVFSDTHPQVATLLTQIANLEAVISGTSEDPSVPNSARTNSQMQQNLDQINANLAFIDQQRVDMESQLIELERSVSQTPNVEMTLNTLNREYAAKTAEHNLAVSRMNTASIGEAVETRQKGERFEVIEQASIPETPVSPNRIAIATGGIMGGLFAALGLVVLLELLNTSIRRPIELTKGLGIQPFATIPYIVTRREKIRSRLRFVLGTIVVILGIPALLYAVNMYFMPIDEILTKVLDRFGLSSLARIFG